MPAGETITLRLRIPDPVGSRTAGAPDACLACHRGKDSAWVAQHIPGQASATGARYPHAPLLAAARGGDASIAPQLLDFARDGTRPVMLRAAALRFWLSRLQDDFLPGCGDLVVRRDPDVYRRLLQKHIAAAENGCLPWPEQNDVWPMSAMDNGFAAYAIR